MSLKCGIVGLPNVGKSSLFNRLTRKQNAEVANYPFCTIEPNVAIVPLKDQRLEKLAAMSKSEKILYSMVEFVDIAGLVQNASAGEGLGNKFLSHIAEVDLIINVIRSFESDEIVHIMERVNPLEDFQIIQTELKLSDLQKVTKAKEKKITPEVKKALEKMEGIANDSGEILTNEEMLLLKPYNFLSIKPFIIVVNGTLTNEVKNYCETNKIFVLSLDVLNGSDSEIDQLIEKSFESLGLISYFTTGPKETRAWTILNGANAVEASGAIHTDFMKNFIRAEVTHYDDYINGKKFMLEGKNYIVQSGDVINFRIGK